MTGVGTGVSELAVLAGVSEIVPVSQRGYYLAAVTLSVIPFVPSVMFAQLISNTANWRYISVLTAGIAAVALAMTAVWYNPPPQSVEQRQERLDKRKLARKMDFSGGFLSITGVACIIMGLLGGGYQVSRTRPMPALLAPLTPTDMSRFTVRMDRRPGPMSSGHWRLLALRLWRLGDMGRQVSHGPEATRKSTPISYSHHGNYLHLRRQFLRHHHDLARAGL